MSHVLGLVGLGHPAATRQSAAVLALGGSWYMPALACELSCLHSSWWVPEGRVTGTKISTCIAARKRRAEEQKSSQNVNFPEEERL